MKSKYLAINSVANHYHLDKMRAMFYTDLHGASAAPRSGLLLAALAALSVHAGAVWLLSRETSPGRPPLAEIDLRFSAAPRPAPLSSPAEPAVPRPEPVAPRPPESRPVPAKPRVETPKPADVADAATPVAAPSASASPEVASAAADSAPASSATASNTPTSALPATGPATPSAPVFDADYLQNPEPDYPPLSRRLREQGEVLLRVRVRADGTPADVELETSSGFPRLDQSAIAAVKRWRFVPARLGNEAVEASVLVPVKFVYHRA